MHEIYITVSWHHDNILMCTSGKIEDLLAESAKNF
jgi:hypothetical protein